MFGTSLLLDPCRVYLPTSSLVAKTAEVSLCEDLAFQSFSPNPVCGGSASIIQVGVEQMERIYEIGSEVYWKGPVIFKISEPKKSRLELWIEEHDRGYCFGDEGALYYLVQKMKMRV
jgi:hypothetical protein